MSADEYMTRAAVEFEGPGLDPDGDVLVLHVPDCIGPDCYDPDPDDTPERDDRMTDERDHDAPTEPGDDPDLATLNEYQREDWASAEGIGQGERRRRLALVDAWDRANRPELRQYAAERSGWADVPLDAILDGIEAGTFALPVPSVGMLSDASAGLLYPGRVNGIAGESGAGKGWLALTIAAEQMGLGRHVYYLDFEDSPALALLRLVRVLRIDGALVRHRFHYLHPARHDDEGIAAFVARVASTPSAFVVVDSTGEALAAAGKNQNHDDEVAAWFQSLAHPLADDGGATVLLLDHMVKSEDGGLWPIGSQRKRAAITGAQYVAEVAQPFSRTTNGMVALRVAKDRHGAREARSVATYVQFEHPVESIVTEADGTVVVTPSEALDVTLGLGKSAAQVKSDREAKAAAALAADVAALDALDPKPTSYRDAKTRLNWRDDRAQAAMRAWRARGAA